jgi:uncharacterized protein (DUF2147 family)
MKTVSHGDPGLAARLVLWLFIACVLLVPRAAPADEPDAIIGQWLADDGSARFEIFKADGKYHGKIVWLKDPAYGPADKEPGKPVHDRHNPDASKRNQPLVGLVMLKDFEYTGGNKWEEGTIYNPDSGKTYNANLSLKDPTRLKVHGYIGISLIGGSTIWTRWEGAGQEQKPSPAP